MWEVSFFGKRIAASDRLRSIVFSHIAPSPISPDFDMGACCCCQNKDDDRRKRRRRMGRREAQRHRRRQAVEHSQVAWRADVDSTFSLLQPGQVCVATFPYDPGSAAEVKLEKGDRVELLSKEKDSEDFVFVRQLKANGARGYVATNVLAPEGSIEAEDYYFGPVRRRDAVKILRNEDLPAGAFLIRDSETRYGQYDGGSRVQPDVTTQYVLSVKDAGDPADLHHYRIYDSGLGRRYYIATATRFHTMRDVVEHYRTHDGLPEVCCKLTTPVIRPPPVRKALSKDMMDRWREIPRDEIQLIKKLGAGNFGEVWQATWKRTGGSSIDVAVKQLKDVTPKAKDDLFNEASAMRDLFHKNIVRLYGVVSSGEPYMMVTELMQDGSLKVFLQNRLLCRLPALPDLDLIDIATQVCRGMAYLEANRVVHRDLAARNVLITNVSQKPIKIEAKICDFGLARILHNSDIYKMGRDTPMARKWLAPEAFNKNVFTSKSDVWAFGATLCEIFSEGADPFGNIDENVLVKHLRRGQRPPTPKALRRAGLEDLIFRPCTHPRPDQRPAFDEMLADLESMLSGGTDP